MDYRAETHLEKIKDICERREERTSFYKRADRIYLLAGEAAHSLRLQLEDGREILGFEVEEYFSLVYATAHETIDEIRERERLPQGATCACAQAKERIIVSKLAYIRSAMNAVKQHFADEDPSASSRSFPSYSSETTISNQSGSTMTMTLVIKHNIRKGGYKDQEQTFYHLPDFLDLQGLGEKLFHHNTLTVREFILKLDGTVLNNENTRRLLKNLFCSGCRRVLIFLELIPGDGDGDLRFSELSRADVATQTVSQEKFLICIDGNIGSNKSLFMEQLLLINKKHRQQRVKVIQEPLKKLDDELTKFHDALKAGKEVTDEQKEQSSRFEQLMFDHHLEVATDPENRNNHIISGRSMAAKIRVFNDLNYGEGRLLKEYRDDMQKQYDLKIKGSHEPHAVIFFEIPVRKAMERIQERARPSEKHITEEFLLAIEKKYQELYPPEAEDVIRLNSDQPMEDLIVSIQDKLPEVLRRCSPASEDEIGDFMKFFQDVRGEPCAGQPPAQS